MGAALIQTPESKLYCISSLAGAQQRLPLAVCRRLAGVALILLALKFHTCVAAIARINTADTFQCAVYLCLSSAARVLCSHQGGWLQNKP